MIALTLAPPISARSQTSAERDKTGACQSPRDLLEVSALPREEYAKRHREQKRQKQPNNRRVEERRAHRNFVAGRRFERQGIKRANQNDAARRREQEIIKNEAAFAGNDGESAAARKGARAPRKQSQTARCKGRHNR